jgi:5'-nucleotidase / UDP-sugar diphosphatase
MNRKMILGALALAAVAAGGCQSNANNKQANAATSKTSLRPAVTDIAPTPPAAYISPVQQPIQPVVVAAAATAEPVATAAPAAAPAAGKGSYTVQKGDTLYKIARERYGDGKQWQKIASANPGLSPSTLKVGQKIMIP